MHAELRDKPGTHANSHTDVRNHFSHDPARRETFSYALVRKMGFSLELSLAPLLLSTAHHGDPPSGQRSKEKKSEKENKNHSYNETS
jgi:hypothetical protein